MSDGMIEIRGLRVGYGDAPDVLAVDELRIRPGEFLSVLGPSGCGKTTLLNTVAGFVMPRAGHVAIDGRDVTRLPTHRRGLGLVFQSYALFPHMSVAKNLEYGLRTRRVPRAERAARVEEALAVVGLAEFAGRMPHQLSGGQQQRVALARAIVIRPSVLLLDESLSSLDAKLRREMQRELREIQQRVGTTMIFVTHDQDEALTMSDRVAVFARGRLEQLGTPEEIYRRPATEFVADFVGAANILRGIVASAEAVVVGDDVLPLASSAPIGSEVTFAVRSESIELVRSGGAPARVVYRAYSGDHWELRVALSSGIELRCTVRGGEMAADPVGANVGVRWAADAPIVVGAA